MAGVVSALKQTFTILPSCFASHLWVRTNGNGSPRTSTPTKIKEYAEENPQTAVGEGLAPPEKTTAHRTYWSVENVTTNGADSRGRLSLQMLRDTPKKFS